MKKMCLLLGLCTCFLLQSQDAAKDSTDTRWQMLTYDVGNIFKGVGHSYARPLHWEGKQWAQFGAVIGGTGLVYLAHCIGKANNGHSSAPLLEVQAWSI